MPFMPLECVASLLQPATLPGMAAGEERSELRCQLAINFMNIINVSAFWRAIQIAHKSPPSVPVKRKRGLSWQIKNCGWYSTPGKGKLGGEAAPPPNRFCAARGGGSWWPCHSHTIVPDTGESNCATCQAPG